MSGVPEKALAALDRLDVDGFCRLTEDLSSPIPVEARRLEIVCNRLVRSGLMNGLEAVLERTGIQPTLQKTSIARGYDVLIASGRLEAADYLSQLSGLPVRLSDAAVRAGYSHCLFTGKIRTIEKLIRWSGVPFVESIDDLRAAIDCAQIEDDKYAVTLLRELEGGKFSRPHSGPIYVGTRSFLGAKDLVVSLYTKACPFKCTFSTLPIRSSNEDIAPDDINRQIDSVWARYRSLLPQVEQLAIGNEGSILDETRYPRECLEYLCSRAKKLPRFKTLSLETRPEYIRENVLADIIKAVGPGRLDLTIGFETQDDELRNKTLNKSIHRDLFEQKIRLMGKLGVRLTAYVLLKPDPKMNEEQGYREAVRTIEYLADLCKEARTSLIIYLNPMYIARGSTFEVLAEKHDYRPPSLSTVHEIIAETRSLKVPIYVGLSNEGLADQGKDFFGRSDFDPSLLQALHAHNRSPRCDLTSP